MYVYILCVYVYQQCFRLYIYIYNHISMSYKYMSIYLIILRSKQTEANLKYCQYNLKLETIWIIGSRFVSKMIFYFYLIKFKYTEL